MMKHSKKIPKFETEDKEREFWSKRDSTPYIEYRRAVRTSFPNLKPSSRTISIRLPESLLENIKVIANRADVPYQSMMKVILDEKVSEILRAKTRKKPTA
jgi:predicted DNA binding CopG/RHH family protein